MHIDRRLLALLFVVCILISVIESFAEADTSHQKLLTSLFLSDGRLIAVTFVGYDVVIQCRQSQSGRVA